MFSARIPQRSLSRLVRGKRGWVRQPQYHRNVNISSLRLEYCQRSLYYNRTVRFVHSESQQTGLFGLAEFQCPNDFIQAASRAMADCDVIRNKLSDTTAALSVETARETLRDLDSISRLVCNVMDAAELCRNVHADVRWRESAQNSFQVLSEYLTILNTDKNLHQHLQQIATATSVFDQLSIEEQRFVHLLKAEFERDGIHLSDDNERENVRQLQLQVTQLETLFMQNIHFADDDGSSSGNNKHTISVDAHSVYQVVTKDVLQSRNIDIPQDQQNDNTMLELPQSDLPLLQTLLQNSTDPILRKEVYMASMTALPDNVYVLSELIQRRTALAQALGFETFAHRFLQDKMAKCPANVKSFLDNLSLAVKPSFIKEMETVQHVKRQVEGSSMYDKVEAWDVLFYTNAITNQLQQQQEDNSQFDQISSYFNVEQSVSALVYLVDQLFDIFMNPVELSPNEMWDINPKQSNASSSLRRYDLSHNLSGKELGSIYFDLHPRPAKFGHAAHFTVRCGCTVDHNVYQKPIIALVCNFGSESSNWSSNMAHREVETLFHEFGHALHSLLSRTQFQHMSGTRAAIDFVETPSHLIENYAWEDGFLKLLSTNSRAKNGMPNTLIQSLKNSRHQFGAIEKQNQILYASFDQAIFGTADINTDPQALVSLYAKQCHQLSIPHADGTHWFSRFGHLVNYGAGYYSYLYAHAFSSDIWQSCLAENPLDKDVGNRLWHGLLQHGGARDPEELLINVLGRPPRVKTELKA